MSEQDEALRLAETTPSLRGGDWGDRSSSELRRLHAEVNEQARLNGMGAERELALMAKLEAATRARQQAQEALYAERDRCAKVVQRLQAEIGRLSACHSQNETCAPQESLPLVAAPQAWSPAYTRGPARQSAPVAAAPALVPLTDAAWLEYLLKHADTSTLDLAAFRGESIQNRGLWVLRVQANDLRKLVERAHGIGLTVGDGGTV